MTNIYPMRATLLLFLVAATLVTTKAASASTVPGIVSQHGRLQVAGNRIVGQDGQPVSLAGISFGWSQWEAARFYNANTVNWLKQDWHAQIVRAALGLHAEPAAICRNPPPTQPRSF